MRRTGVALLLILALAAGAAADEAADGHVVYVSPAGDDAWTGRCARPQADRTDGPVRTLQRARDLVRGLIRAGLDTDVTVLVGRGTYPLPDGLTLGPEDSGTATHAVTWQACPGEAPALVGGVAVTGWQPWKGGVETAPIPAGIEPNQLFEGGRRLALARHPDTGYLKVAAAVPGRERTCFVYRAGDLDPTGWDTASGRIFCWPTRDWFSAEAPIASVDPATRTITLARPVNPIKAGNRFVVRNVLALLDQPGEACIDLGARRLYVRRLTDGAPAAPIVAATARHVLAIEGRSPDRLVRNVHVVGLDISVARGDAIRMTGVEDCSVRFSTVENGGERGIYVAGHAQRVTLYGNLIREHGRHGVEFSGPGPGRADVNHHHTVENNHIHHCGRLVGHGYGVRIQQSGHNRICHNHIHHMPRYATTIKGTRYQLLRQHVKGVTWANHYDFLHSRGNRFAYNHIHHVNLDSQDTGAMESWGPGRDNVYDHNLIHDVGNREFDIQSGFYLDDATDYFTVTNNIVYNVVGTHGNQPIYAKGIGNRIENNIFVAGPHCESGIRSFFMADERCDHHTYARNIIVFEGEPAAARGRFGAGVGNIHAKGKTLTWKVRVPADGDYALWMRYAAHNAPHGMTGMDGRTTMQADGEQPVTLANLPNTGGWGNQAWSRAATLHLRRGARTLTWTNVKGGGMNWDAFVLVTDPAWQPTGVSVAAPAAGHHLVLVQTETHTARPDAGVRGYVYRFDNWSDDRVSASDRNLFWAQAGGALAMRGGKAGGPLDAWRRLLGGRFDAASVVADPKFVDLAGRDFRLQPSSPALALGFVPIDTSRIGLKDDFPARFDRE